MVTVTTHQSYGSRLRESLKSLIFVPILLIIAIVLLVWNEGNSIRQQKALNEGLKVVVEVGEGVTQIDVGLDGKLIHFTGTAAASDRVYDNIFGVGQQNESENFLKVRRNVKMYQWVESTSTEEKKNLGGSTDTTTTYSYSKQWEDRSIDSASFRDSSGHTNPDNMLFDNEIFDANVVVGNFTLSSALSDKIYWWELYKDNLNVENILDDFARTEATSMGDSYYFGIGTKTKPEIGDTIVDFEVVESQVISVVAMQFKGELSAYTGKSGGTVLLIERGYRDPNEMFDRASDAMTVQTWILRLVGWLIVYLACYIAIQPLSVFADVIPFLGNLIEAGNCCFSSLLSFIITFFVVAIAWFAYRPVLSAILLAVLVVLVVVCWLVARHVGGKKRARQHPGDDHSLHLEEENEDNTPIAEVIESEESDDDKA